MSSTKALAKRLPTLSTANVVTVRDELARCHATEKNPMIRSSLLTRMQLCTAEILRRARVANARYCVPWNAGLASETGAVCRRIGRLLTALDTEINSNICDGKIVEDIREFRYQLLRRLEASGWTLSYDGGNHMKVRQPGHKRPFEKRTIAERS